MYYCIFSVIGLCIGCIIWLLKQVYTLKKNVSSLQQNAIDLEYSLQRGWANNSEKVKRLVENLGQKIPIYCVTFKDIDRKLYVTSSKMNLLTLAREDNIAISTGCYGEGTCGQCAFVPIEGVENLNPCTEKETLALQMFNYPKNARLSCQCRINGNMMVELLQPIKI